MTTALDDFVELYVGPNGQMARFIESIYQGPERGYYYVYSGINISVAVLGNDLIEPDINDLGFRLQSSSLPLGLYIGDSSSYTYLFSGFSWSGSYPVYGEYPSGVYVVGISDQLARLPEGGTLDASFTYSLDGAVLGAGIDYPPSNTATVTVRFIGINDAPTFDVVQKIRNIQEGQTFVDVVTATDVDVGQSLAYSISGGADAALFSIDATTGVLSFQSAPEFAAPADQDGDGIYNVQVRATDSNGAMASQSLAITILDVEPEDLVASAETRANNSTASSQDSPSIAALADGRYVVMWRDLSNGANWDIRGQLYNADGTKAGGELLVYSQIGGVPTTGGQQEQPQIAALPDGGFAVAWTDGPSGGSGGDGDQFAIHIQRYAVSGNDVSSVRETYRMNVSAAGTQERPTVTTLPDGSVAVAWWDNVGGVERLLGRTIAFTDVGAVAGPEHVLEAATGDIAWARIAATAGGVLVAWTEHGGDNIIDSMHARLFSPDLSTPLSDAVVVTGAAANDAGIGVADLGGGRFVIVWAEREESVSGDGSGSAVRGQIYELSAGALVPVGAQLDVNTTTAAAQIAPAVAVLSDGTFVVTWADQSGAAGTGAGSDIRGQIFTADGSRLGTELLVNATIAGNQGIPAIAAGNGGQFLIAWTDESGGTSDIAARAFDLASVNDAPVITAPGTMLGDGAGSGQTAIESYDTSGNFAAVQQGAAPAVVSGVLAGSEAFHAGDNVNDSAFGNASAWIPGNVGNWLKIDLGQETLIDSVTLARDRLGQYTDREIGPFEIRVARSDDVYANGNSSNDGAEYTTVASGAGYPMGNPGLEAPLTVSFTPTIARYILVNFTGASQAIDEVVVNGKRIVVEAPDGSAEEQGNAVSTRSGTFFFTDADPGDGHTVSVTPLGAGYRGSLSAVVTDSATGDGKGAVTWTYTVDDAALDSLGAGQRATQSWRVTVDDGRGGTTSRDVDVVLEGTGDFVPLPYAIERVSVSSAGVQGNHRSQLSSISADGRFVTFASTASNLASGDSIGTTTYDIFVRDREAGTTTLLTPGSNGFNWLPSISDDGRFVSFTSNASNLAAGDSNGATADIFVHDLQTSTITILTPGGDSSSEAPSISSDGRFVAFGSLASNLVAGDNHSDYDIFVYDRESSTTILLTPGANSRGIGPSISANGQFVTFTAYGSDLLGTEGAGPGIAVYDHQTGTTTLLTPGGNGESSRSSMSADGRFVSFQSSASNLSAGDTNGATPDIFVHDRQLGTTTLLTPGGNGGSFEPSISADGRFVTFVSSASNLVVGDDNDLGDIFVHDRTTGTTALLTPGGNGQSDSPAISADGRFVSFSSNASNFVAGDTNGSTDVFVIENPLWTAPNTPPTAAPDAATTAEDTGVAIAVLANDADPDNDTLTITEVGTPQNGSAFVSAAGEITYSPSFNFAGTDSFTYTISDGNGGTSTATVTVTVTPVNDGGPTPGAPGQTTDEDTAITVAAGQGLLADAIDPDGDPISLTAINGAPVTFGAPITLPSGAVLTVAADGSYTYDPAPSALFQALVGPDGAGQTVAYDTITYTLSDGELETIGALQVQVNGVTDRATAIGISGTLVPEGADNGVIVGRLSVDDADFAPLPQFELLDDAGGRFVLTGDNSIMAVGEAALFDYETATSHTIRVRYSDGEGTELTRDITIDVADLPSSRPPADLIVASRQADGTPANGFQPVLSGDGRFVAFITNTPLVGPTLGENDVYLYDRQTRTTEVVSVKTGGGEATNSATDPAMSADGNVIAFIANDGDLVDGDTQNGSDIFVRDRAADTTVRITAGIDGAGANNVVSAPAVSADGRYIAYSSIADNLVTGDGNGAWDTFVHDRTTGETERIELAYDGQPIETYGTTPGISGDGRFVLITGNSGGQQLYLYDRSIGTTELVTATPDGTPSTGGFGAPLFKPAMSADGRYVTFVSPATDLVADGTSGNAIFVRDTVANTTERLVVPASGQSLLLAFGSDVDLEISDDGRFVAFTSPASSLVDGDTNRTATTTGSDVFVFDRQTGEIRRASTTPTGLEAETGQLFDISLSGDGTVVAFQTASENLLPGSTAFGVAPIFVADLVDGPAPNTAPVAVDDSGATAEDTAVTFTAADLLANDTDLDGDTLTLTAVGNAVGGTVSLAGGIVTFTPDAELSGTASFDYTVADGNGGSDTGTVTVAVGAVNDPAVIGGTQAGTVTEDAGAGQVATGQLTIDDADGAAEASFQAGSIAGTYGSLALTAAGAWTYTLDNANAAVQALNSGEALSDPIAVRSTDGTEATITISINGANETTAITNGDGDGFLAGTTGDDIIDAAGGADVVNAGAGNDTVLAGAGEDVVNGGSGNDKITGGAGDDVVIGGSGDDTIMATPGDGNDLYSGGSGSDTFDASAISSPISVSLGSSLFGLPINGVGQATGAEIGTDRIVSIENVVGGGGGDSIRGDGLANKLSGGAGSDSINGGAGADTISGDEGNDILTGGAGSDTFVFRPGFGNDRITDFDANPNNGQDFIELSGFGIDADNFSARVQIADVGRDTLATIDADPAQTIRLSGIGNAGTVTVDDFRFS